MTRAGHLIKLGSNSFSALFILISSFLALKLAGGSRYDVELLEGATV